MKSTHGLLTLNKSETKFAKVMFSQVCVCPLGGGGIRAGREACMAGGCALWGACVAWGHAWWGACMVGGMHGRRECMHGKGACLAGGMHATHTP